MLDCAAPIDIEVTLRAEAALISLVTDFDRQPCRPSLSCALPPRHRNGQLCAVCRCVDVPAQLPILRLMQHAAVARVHVPCGAAPPGAILLPLAAREAVRAWPRHHEQGVGCRCCTNEQHQKQLAREGRAEY